MSLLVVLLLLLLILLLLLLSLLLLPRSFEVSKEVNFVCQDEEIDDVRKEGGK